MYHYIEDQCGILRQDNLCDSKGNFYQAVKGIRQDMSARMRKKRGSDGCPAFCYGLFHGINDSVNDDRGNAAQIHRLGKQQGVGNDDAAIVLILAFGA